MPCHSTVSNKPFASKRCSYVCQQNLVIHLYYVCTTRFENLAAFPNATMKLQTFKSGHRSKIQGSSLTLSRFERLYLCNTTGYTHVKGLKIKVKDSSINQCN